MFFFVASWSSERRDVLLREAVQRGQHRPHVDDVVDAAAEIRARDAIAVDADQQGALGHGDASGGRRPQRADMPGG
jgi:hypothetical protein